MHATYFISTSLLHLIIITSLLWKDAAKAIFWFPFIFRRINTLAMIAQCGTARNSSTV